MMKLQQVKDNLQVISLEAKRNKRGLLFTAVDMLVNFLKYHVYPLEYYYFGFYKKSKENKKTYFTYKDRKNMIHKINDSRYLNCLDDKYLFSKIFHDLYGRKALRTDTMTYEELSELARECDKVIYKPLAASKGKGIEVIDIPAAASEEALKDLYDILKAYPAGIVESWICQSDEMNLLYADSICCIRVVTVNWENEVSVTGATLTVGSKKSRIANADSGGLFGLVDENTGTVLSDYISYDGFIKFETHPDTGKAIKGYQIPEWDKVISLVKKAARRIPQMGYISWDVSLTKDGPVLIEGNANGGYRGYQLAGVAPGNVGTRHKYEKYLKIRIICCLKMVHSICLP